MPSTTTAKSHEAAQKKLWKQELRELRTKANQLVAGQVKALRTANARVRDLRKELTKAERQAERVRKQTAATNSIQLTSLENRMAALRGRIES